MNFDQDADLSDTSRQGDLPNANKTKIIGRKKGLRPILWDPAKFTLNLNLVQPAALLDFLHKSSSKPNCFGRN